ncbi:4'-phosphopantetheinyl transferase superfamily protein [Nocardiopsis sp. HNM0947]|uniref:4'-phosphopantetheinyl transferase superfamily protein n=1 Tax=Nocardiopsis coralli TaxID=2772213 RepID=A0ABR9PB70_9ACTN|nr:4'-phosphopantetheinyl transferase superfamily protein [Nocardiopsis coralli]MBE3001079.1 4'-phosphopantetheinyl transferase superfamily protein [Nocardiopsis coralli]
MSPDPTPTPLTTTVWWAHTSAASSRLVRLLDEGERTRNERFRLQADRDRHLLGRAMARLALAELSGCPPEFIAFDLRCRSCEDKERAGAERDRSPHGKPFPIGAAQGWEFSVSHSGEWVALAVTEGVPVGVDVERVAPARDLDGLAGYTLADPEHRAWAGLGEPERTGAFYGYWARKEALLKATGLGLSGGLRRVTVSAPHEAAEFVSWEGGGAPGPVWLSDLEREAEYRSAVAVLTDRAVDLRVRTAQETVSELLAARS